MTLGACVGRKKSDANRMMSEADLEDNIGETLRRARTTVSDVVKKLLNFDPPLLTRHGRSTFRATAEGERAKHVFDQLKNELVVYGVPRDQLVVPEAYDFLLEVMGIVCDDPAISARALAEKWRERIRRS